MEQGISISIEEIHLNARGWLTEKQLEKRRVNLFVLYDNMPYSKVESIILDGLYFAIR